MVQDLGGDRFKRSRLDPTGEMADEVRRLRSELDVVKKMGRAPSGIGAEVYNSAIQSINDSAWTDVSFDVEVKDTGGFFGGISTTRFTVPTDGFYLLMGQVSFDVNATGIRLLRLYLNGASQIARHSHGPASGVSHNLMVAKMTVLSAADYVTLSVYQNSGGALNLLAGVDDNYYSIWRLA
jgi:hypothetical protein